jgi:hypothetical protein
MNTKAKVLIPNKTWILQNQGTKLGTLNREKKGYSFLRNGSKIELTDLAEVKEKFGTSLFKESLNYKNTNKNVELKSIYDYPCRTKPFNPVYNIRKKLPIYAKSSKSKSLYCAGYYIVKFRKGWTRAFCPKLITLERYPFHGPYKSEEEMKISLEQANKNYEAT